MTFTDALSADEIHWLRELFAVVGDICDSGDYLSLEDGYRDLLYEAFCKLRESEIGKRWESEFRAETARLHDLDLI